MRAADIEIGGVEYMIDDRDGQRYYYDINALSNFVADAPRVIGFDPFARLATGSRRRRTRPSSGPAARPQRPCLSVRRLSAERDRPNGRSEGIRKERGCHPPMPRSARQPITTLISLGLGAGVWSMK